MQQFLTQNLWVLIAVAAWTVPWKAVALWKAARNGSKGWFVVLLLINTLAILEIAYIFFFSKKSEEEISAPAPKRMMYL